MNKTLTEVLKAANAADRKNLQVAACIVFVDDTGVSIMPTMLPDLDKVTIGGLGGGVSVPENGQIAQLLVAQAADVLNAALNESGAFDNDKSQLAALADDGEGGLIDANIAQIMGKGELH